MPWKIIKTEKEVFVEEDAVGPFKLKDDAIVEAKKLAREHKLIAKLQNHKDELTDDSKVVTLDYTSFFDSHEILERSISELKLAKAEKNVSRLELIQRKDELKHNKNDHERLAYKEKVKNATIRFKKAKLNLKAAEKRIKLLNKKAENQY